MKKILFVDDEKKVIDGLRRTLRSMRHEWDMHFVESGQMALDWLEKNSCDVIVSDMRMPGMDGVQLLGEVRQRHPHMIRLALSGHSEMEMLLESVRATHQFLTKPCEAKKLKSTVERACGLMAMLDNDGLRTTVSQIDSLPSLPSLYVEVMDEIRAYEGSIIKVGEIIEKNLAMTAKILQIFNSAFFGLERHVSSASQATTLLGVDIISSLILTTKVFSSFDQDMGGLDLDELWQHSTLVGSLARQIALAEGLDSKACDYALMAGMLHDLGKLVLAAHRPQEYVGVFASGGQDERQIWQSECEIFGCSHMEVGAYLLNLWGFPNPIVEVVAYHHTPCESVSASFNPLTAVYIANYLLEGYGDSGETENLIDQDYLTRLGLLARVPDWQGIHQQLIEKESNNRE